MERTTRMTTIKKFGLILTMILLSGCTTVRTASIYQGSDHATLKLGSGVMGGMLNAGGGFSYDFRFVDGQKLNQYGTHIVELAPGRHHVKMMWFVQDGMRIARRSEVGFWMDVKPNETYKAGMVYGRSTEGRPVILTIKDSKGRLVGITVCPQKDEDCADPLL